MGMVTPQSDEIAISVGALSNIAGMAWTAADDDLIFISFKKINHHFYVDARCNKNKISVDAHGEFRNRSEIPYRFRIKDFRKFVKKITSCYASMEGKVFIKLDTFKLQVTMPSMIGAELAEATILGFSDCDSYGE